MTRRPTRAVWAAGLLAAAIAVPARADHTAARPITHDTAYTLAPWQPRVGLWQLDWNLGARWMATTWTVPWWFRTPSARLKWQFWSGAAWSVAASVAYVAGEVQDWVAASPPASVRAVPLDLTASCRWDDATWSVGARWTHFAGSGAAEQGEIRNGAARGSLAASTLYLHTDIELRWSPRVASVLVLRAVPLQDVETGGTVRWQPDPYTTVEVVGGVGYRPAGVSAAQAGLLTAWSWQHLQVTLGAVYGRPILPIVAIPVPRDPLWLPEFDVAWAF